MATFLKWLGLFAPWVWTAASITGLLVCGRAWWLARLFRSQGVVTRYIEKTSLVRLMRLVGFSIVGVTSIAIYFAYPSLHQQAFPAPVLLQCLQLFTLLSLLTAPVIDVMVGYWTLRFLLDDPLK